mmetsp:Transcript_13690/g.45667  ORF Transcript_13690/g.45667 Transcript_13690/m.45667 type:complete len:230 (+) Transcript_13690:140-829(+)
MIRAPAVPSSTMARVREQSFSTTSDGMRRCSSEAQVGDGAGGGVGGIVGGMGAGVGASVESPRAQSCGGAKRQTFFSDPRVTSLAFKAARRETSCKARGGSAFSAAEESFQAQAQPRPRSYVSSWRAEKDLACAFHHGEPSRSCMRSHWSPKMGRSDVDVDEAAEAQLSMASVTSPTKTSVPLRHCAKRRNAALPQVMASWYTILARSSDAVEDATSTMFAVCVKGMLA